MRRKQQTYKMPNPNYVKGRRKEYKICKELRSKGFDIVQRTAGSHSPIDVIAINKKLRVIKFIQSKPDTFSERERESIECEFHWLSNMFRCEFEVE